MKIILFLLLLTITLNAFTQLQPVGSGVFHWNELPVKKDNQRETRKIAEGTTNEFKYFEIHATTQSKGAVPKPAHTQKDVEEIIIIKEGAMKCSIGTPNDAGYKNAVLGKGSVLLIPPLQPQVFENVGNGPLTYYVFMFRSKKEMDIERSNRAGGALLINYDSLTYKETNNKGTRKFFERPAAMCNNYEMHITYLKQKGPSHAGHQHVDTEIILVIDGETEMTIDGKTYRRARRYVYS